MMNLLMFLGSAINTRKTFVLIVIVFCGCSMNWSLHYSGRISW